MGASMEVHEGLCACGGDITEIAWSSDCRGNDAGLAISCGSCDRVYTPAELERDAGRSRMSDVDDIMDARAWRYGPARGVSGHRPEPNGGRVCVAAGPDGRICGRGVNRVGSSGQVRHNPRPYGRSGRTSRRRRIG